MGFGTGDAMNRCIARIVRIKNLFGHQSLDFLTRPRTVEQDGPPPLSVGHFLFPGIRAGTAERPSHERSGRFAMVCLFVADCLPAACPVAEPAAGGVISPSQNEGEQQEHGAHANGNQKGIRGHFILRRLTIQYLATAGRTG